MRALPLSWLVFLSTCCSPSCDSLTHVRHAGTIEIRAASSARADEVARTVDAELPLVRSMLGDGCREIPRGLICVFEKQGAGSRGTTHEELVELFVGADAEEFDLRYLVAHELTHYFAGSEWRRLPAVLEEGLCELIAQRAVPDGGTSRRVEHAINVATMIQRQLRSSYPMQVHDEIRVVTWTLAADIERSSMPTAVGALQLSHQELHELEPDRNKRALTSFGYLLATRIGLEGLGELCRETLDSSRDVATPAAVFDAAKLDAANPMSWMPYVVGLATPAEIAQTILSPALRSRVTFVWQ